MIEQYISLETAKLLKEKGFSEKTTSGYYNVDGVQTLQTDLFADNHNKYNDSISAPSQDMVLRELRKKRIYVDVRFNRYYQRFRWFEYSMEENTQDEAYEGDDFPSYEEAVEAAIKWCYENKVVEETFEL